MGSEVNYTRFSRFLAGVPDAVSFVRFRELHIKSLLLYQAELIDLQRQLQNIVDLDATENPDIKDRVDYLWTADEVDKVRLNNVQRSKFDGCGAHSVKGGSDATEGVALLKVDYIQKVFQIRETLIRYNEALDQFAKQEKLASPSRKSMQNISDWLRDTALGGTFLTRTTQDVWSSARDPNDLLILSESDKLSTIFARLYLFARTRFTKDPSKMYRVEVSSEGHLAQSISVVLSSLLPVLPILVFYFVDRLITRIGLILLFTAVFAAILVFGLKMSPETVLAITTAIAAVQVVYVGGTAPPNS